MHFTTFTKRDVENNVRKLKPGNFIVTHGNDFFDVLIRFFTMSYWNHCALVVSSDGTIVELTSKGMEKHTISKYKLHDIYIVDVEMSEEDRKQAVEFSEVMLKAHEKYGFFTIASIVFKIIMKSRLIIKLDGTMICSEFVGRAISQGGIIWDRDPSLITPADLYNRFVKKQ